MSVNITEDTLEAFEKAVTETTGQVVVDFWAAWCGPCRAVSPILETLEQEGKITLIKIDVDANPQIAGAFQISSIPTLGFFKDGKMNKPALIGAYPKAAIEAHIN